MPYIPDLTPDIPGRVVPVAPDTGVAMAPGNALQKVGNAISGAGEVAGAIQLRFQAARDIGVKNHARLAMQQAYAEHQKFRLENPDESTWGADMEKRVGAVRERVFQEKMSPFAKEELDAEFQGWAQESQSGVMLDATKQGVARARQRVTNAAKAYADAGDYESARKVIKESRGPVFLPEEADADLHSLDMQEKEAEREEAFKADVAEIDADPFGASEKYESSIPPEGADPTEYHRKRDHWKSRLAQSKAEVVNAISDGIASNKIVTRDQLDPYRDTLGESLVKKIGDDLDAMADEKQKAMQKQPGYQVRLIGAVAAGIDEVERDDVERQYDLQRMLARMEDGPTKSSLTARLKARIEGKTPDTNALSMATGMARDALRNGWFGNVTRPDAQSTADVEGDGFLLDANKLKLLFNEKDAAAITDPALKPQERLAKFRSLFPKRDTSKDNPEDATLRAARAIYERKNTVPRTQAELIKADEERRAAVLRHGKVYDDLMKWAAANPKAAEDYDAVMAELLRLAAPGRRDDFISNSFGAEFDTDPELGVLPSQEEMANPQSLDLPDP